MTSHVKRGSPSQLGAEAAGLRWLKAASADGGCPVADVVRVTDDRLEVRLVPSRPVDADAAASFGARLAATHGAAATTFGQAPPGAPGDGWIAALPLPYQPAPTWGPWYAAARVRPFLRLARDRGAIDAAGTAVVERVCARLDVGDPDVVGPPEPPSRLHGDLWAGNVVFGPDPERPGAGTGWLIDPAAHGGHRETDLAMLMLFGLAHLDVVLAAYEQAAAEAGRPLGTGWRRRAPLHQLHPLLVHAALFGGGYGLQTAAAARHWA